MYFLQATQAPVTIRLGKFKLVVPKMEMQDVIAWAEEIYAAQLEKILEDMGETQRREYLTFYGKVQPTFEEMKRLLRTPAGVERVVKVCLPRADVFVVEDELVPDPKDKKKKIRKIKSEKPVDKLNEQQVDSIFQTNGSGRWAGLAYVLADMDDTSVLEDPNPDPDERPDPLSKPETAGSKN